eukprot:scaffold116530_cov16-Tisochrysis_lutea.AAC.1
MVTTMMEPKVCSFCSLTTTIARLATSPSCARSRLGEQKHRTLSYTRAWTGPLHPFRSASISSGANRAELPSARAPIEPSFHQLSSGAK